MATSVLLLADQHRDRAPNRCVVSGEPTSAAVRVRVVPRWLPAVAGDLLGPAAGWAGSATLPVEPAAWTRIRRWQNLAGLVAVIGAAVLVAAVVEGGNVVAGGLVLLAGVALSAVIRRWRWIQVRQGADEHQLVVLRTHPEFDRIARKMFEQGVGADPSMTGWQNPDGRAP